MKNKFKNINEVWDALDLGKTVFWVNESYKIYIEDARPENPDFSKRGNKLLTVRCIENYFGSVLNEPEISQLYTRGAK
jgi:hypothetical protein